MKLGMVLCDVGYCGEVRCDKGVKLRCNEVR